jgi:acetyl-CoA C-acetyltransferase
MSAKHAYLLAGTRTPFGRLNGRLSEFSGLDLGALALAELARRHPILAQSDAAILAMVLQAGQTANPARTILHRSGFGHVPATTLNAACPAGIDTVVDATRRVERGEGALYVVGGVESNSGTPMLLRKGEAPRSGVEHSLTCGVSGLHFTALADRSNRDLGIRRHEQDGWAFLSQTRAAAADFAVTGELFQVRSQGTDFHRDEGIRPTTTLAKLSTLAPVAGGEGSVTAGNASQIADGASVGLVGSLRVAEKMGIEPLARIVEWGYSAGPDGSLHLQPAQAARALLSRTGLQVSDIDLWEINEAFAGVVLASMADLGLSRDVVNPNGGAIALGHPNSATGFRLVLTLAHELRRRGLRRGIATLCGAGGQGIALLIENDRALAG